MTSGNSDAHTHAAIPASLINPGQIFLNRGQLSSTDFDQSRPMNVFITPIPSSDEALIPS
jgi:hypothetical protein